MAVSRTDQDPSNPGREMPKRVRPYGSAADAESAALSRGPRAGGEPVSELASMMMVGERARRRAEAPRRLGALTAAGTASASLGDARAATASRERMGQDLPHLY